MKPHQRTKKSGRIFSTPLQLDSGFPTTAQAATADQSSLLDAEQGRLGQQLYSHHKKTTKVGGGIYVPGQQPPRNFGQFDEKTSRLAVNEEFFEWYIWTDQIISNNSGSTVTQMPQIILV